MLKHSGKLWGKRHKQCFDKNKNLKKRLGYGVPVVGKSGSK